jgi:hypothetical protein
MQESKKERVIVKRYSNVNEIGPGSTVHAG